MGEYDMFSMYDDDGLNFRSTIDQLYNVQGVTPSQTIKNNIKKQNEQNKKDFHGTLKDGNISKEAKDAYKQVANLDTRHDIYHVEEIMTRGVIYIEDSMTILECYDAMKEHNVQQLPIIADNELHLKGMVTANDILYYIMEDVEYAKNNIMKHIYDISTKKIITTDPISDIRRVAKVMCDFDLNAIPVVNGNDILVGIVTRSNILKAVSSVPHMQIWA